MMSGRGAHYGRGGLLRGKVTFIKKLQPSNQEQFCNYAHRICMQNRLDGYEFCIRHILEDKSAPYKPCNYVYPRNGKRCPKAASKLDRKDGYCQEHARRSLLLRQKAARKKRQPETPESLLEELDHYGSWDGLDTKHNMGLGRISNHLGSPAGHAFFPYPQPSISSKIIDYASDSENDKEPLVVDQTWRGDCDSDADSIDNEDEDPLKYAGVYTAEEVALITRDKLIRLQSLYIEQFKRLQYVLREKRRKYLHDLKMEKETLGSIHRSARTTPDEVNQYEKLRALNRYHRLHGPELILHKRAKERRKGVMEGAAPQPTYQTCVHSYDGETCEEHALPLSMFCKKHIVEDPHQVLFRPCYFKEHNCPCPIVPVVNGSACILHTTLPHFSGIGGRDSSVNQQMSMELQDQEPTLMGAGLTSESETTCSAEETDYHDLENVTSYPNTSNSGRSYIVDPEVQHIQDIIRQSEREVFSKLPDKPPEDFLSESALS